MLVPNFNHVLVVLIRFHQTARLALRILLHLLHVWVGVLPHAFDAVVDHICSLLGEAHVYQLELLLFKVGLIGWVEVLLLDH